MMTKYKPGQRVYFLISGRFVTEAIVVTSSSWFVTIEFNKKDDVCIIRLPYSRIFATKNIAEQHIHPALPPVHPASMQKNPIG